MLDFRTLRNAVTGTGMRNAMSYLSDNVLLLAAESREETRGSAHDTRVRDVEISGTGASVS